MSGYYLLKNGEFAYNKSYSVGYDFGSIKRLNRYPMGALSTLYICFALKRHESDFIKAYFDSLKWYREIYMISAEGARNHGLLNVPTEEFFDTKHYLPENTDEQRKIANFLIALERRIEVQQSLVDNLKKYKRGLVNDIFSQRIVPYGERDEWTILPFREVVTINPKTGPLPDEFIYLDLECVNSGKVCAVNIIKRENAPSRAQRLLEKNDVLYQMVRPYQQNNYYYDNTFSSPVVASTGYAQIKCGACDPLFVYEQISSERFAKEAMLRSTGTSYPAINADDLGEIPFFLPSMHIQKKIGAILSLVNQKIFKSEEELQLLKSTKSSLLQQLFI